MQHQAKPVEDLVHQGLDRSSRMTPIVRLRRSARLRATGSGRYPSSATALRTACRFWSLTRGEFCNTSDTSDFDTPARAATVRMVGGLPTDGSLAMPGSHTDRHSHTDAPHLSALRGIGERRDTPPLDGSNSPQQVGCALRTLIVWTGPPTLSSAEGTSLASTPWMVALLTVEQWREIR